MFNKSARGSGAPQDTGNFAYLRTHNLFTAGTRSVAHPLQSTQHWDATNYAAPNAPPNAGNGGSGVIHGSNADYERQHAMLNQHR